MDLLNGNQNLIIINPPYNRLITGIGCPLSSMSATTECRGIHGSKSQDTQKIHAINLKTHNVFT
jgi:hypothetical protein